jgi:hypothetical protein
MRRRTNLFHFLGLASTPPARDLDVPGPRVALFAVNPRRAGLNILSLALLFTYALNTRPDRHVSLFGEGNFFLPEFICAYESEVTMRPASGAACISIVCALLAFLILSARPSARRQAKWPRRRRRAPDRLRAAAHAPWATLE